MGLRATRKKQKRQIRVGDTVTWGREEFSHVVIEVRDEGVVVDATTAGFTRYFVTWEGGALGKGPGIAPLRLVKKGA